MSIFIENHAIFSTSCQFGFREHITQHLYMAVTKLVDKTHELDKKKCYSVGIFLDLSKAFDTIDHNILHALDCLLKIGERVKMDNIMPIYTAAN